MSKLTDVIYNVSQDINSTESDFTVMTIFYPRDSVGVYIYYKNNCEFAYTLTQSSPIDYWQGVIYVLNRYLHSTEQERSAA